MRGRIVIFDMRKAPVNREKNESLTFHAELDHDTNWNDFLRYTLDGFCEREAYAFDMEAKIIKTLDVRPDEEVVVTFTKRKKCPNA
jgi:hypothetical protein